MEVLLGGLRDLASTPGVFMESVCLRDFSSALSRLASNSNSSSSSSSCSSSSCSSSSCSSRVAADIETAVSALLLDCAAPTPGDVAVLVFTRAMLPPEGNTGLVVALQRATGRATAQLSDDTRAWMSPALEFVARTGPPRTTTADEACDVVDQCCACFY
jgi:hypothetical protein